MCSCRRSQEPARRCSEHFNWCQVYRTAQRLCHTIAGTRVNNRSPAGSSQGLQTPKGRCSKGRGHAAAASTVAVGGVAAHRPRARGRRGGCGARCDSIGWPPTRPCGHASTHRQKNGLKHPCSAEGRVPRAPSRPVPTLTAPGAHCSWCCTCTPGPCPLRRVVFTRSLTFAISTASARHHPCRWCRARRRTPATAAAASCACRRSGRWARACQRRSRKPSSERRASRVLKLPCDGEHSLAMPRVPCRAPHDRRGHSHPPPLPVRAGRPGPTHCPKH